MWLWNQLMPAIFGLHAINFWQALGMLVLCKILFGGFRGRPAWGTLARPHDRSLGANDPRGTRKVCAGLMATAAGMFCAAAPNA